MPAATYCQIHLTEDEHAGATPGDEFCVLDFPLGRVGVMIGPDAAFPETRRILALRAAT